MLQVAVYNERQHEQFSCASLKFSLGQSHAADANWFVCASSDVEDTQASVVLEFSIDGDELMTHQGASKSFPYVFRRKETWFEIIRSTEERELVPLQSPESVEVFPEAGKSKNFAGPSSATVSRWLSLAGQVHRFTASSPKFYAEAARLAVESIGLDSAFVLRREQNSSAENWKIVGSFVSQPEYGVAYDPEVLEYLKKEPVAWYQPSLTSPSSSNTVVVAPVVDGQGQLIAAVYGVRDQRGDSRRQGIRPLEARLIQLLAESVAMGVDRQEQEKQAAWTRALLEQAFSPTVADHIQQHPECLAGQQREVTLLFADIRGFTSLAESLPTERCYELLSDVMEQLTQHVEARLGIVVDYYGDGLLALWNAPVEQREHVDLACQAAMKMFASMTELNAKWQEQLGSPLELGIGIHTGEAQVGNAGTRGRIKYGPRGNTVNVAHRVQAASKQLSMPLVITAETQAKLSDSFSCLRICTAKLPDLEKPTELFAVYPAVEATKMKERLDEYAWALELFESGSLDDAEELLEGLLKTSSQTPAHFLAKYTAVQKNKNLARRAEDKITPASGGYVELLAK